jgi:hypothetical protein
MNRCRERFRSMPIWRPPIRAPKKRQHYMHHRRFTFCGTRCFVLFAPLTLRFAVVLLAFDV